MPIALGERARRRHGASRSSHLEFGEDWARWRDEGDAASRDRLVGHYMNRLVRPISVRIHGGLPQSVDVDDLVQQGYLGLMDAMQRFDFANGARFTTFARPRVHGAIQDWLRSIDHVPRMTRLRSKRFVEADERFRKTHGRPPAHDELVRSIREGSADPETIARDGRPAAIIPFSNVTPDNGADGEHDADAMDSFVDPRRSGPLTVAARRDLQRLVTRGFDQRDRLIVVLYYYEQMTMREIGDTLGISESRVSQRLDEIIQCLRARLRHGGCEQEFVFA